MTLGERLAAYRVNKGISQQEIADRMGTSLKAVEGIERGVYYPNLTWLRKYAKALNMEALVSFIDLREEEALDE